MSKNSPKIAVEILTKILEKSPMYKHRNMISSIINSGAKLFNQPAIPTQSALLLSQEIDRLTKLATEKNTTENKNSR